MTEAERSDNAPTRDISDGGTNHRPSDSGAGAHSENPMTEAERERAGLLLCAKVAAKTAPRTCMGPKLTGLDKLAAEIVIGLEIGLNPFQLIREGLMEIRHSSIEAARREERKRCAEIVTLKILECRCERGTPYDIGIMTAVKSVQESLSALEEK